MTITEMVEKHSVFLLSDDVRDQMVYKKDGKLFYKEEWHVDFSLVPTEEHPNNRHRETNESELIEWLKRVKDSSRLSLIQ